MRTPVTGALSGRLALAFAGFIAFGALAQAQEAPPKQVGVVTMAAQDVPRVVTMPGRAVAGEEAQIRPRVGGMVTEILYQPGTPLEPGAPMFRIDATTYEAAVASARADLSSAQAALAQASSAFDRADRLQGSGSTVADVEMARSTMQQAAAAVEAAEAALRVAEAELGWTTITSPIAGLASVAEVSVGDLVTAAQADALATVTRLDPIDVDMYEPSARMMGVIEDVQSGRLQISGPIKATLTLEDGTEYAATGELLAPGFTVSTSTGAVDNRFRFENPGRKLLPGMFLRGQIELGTMRGFLVSQSAVTRDRSGQLSAWVVVDGKASQRMLTDAGTWDHSWIVVDGIAEGDLLIADGLSGLTEGAAVTGVPVTYDDAGVVRDEPAADAAPEAASE